MITIIQKITEGINEVLFPTICTVCGLKLSSNEHFVCTHCLNNNFDEARINNGRSTSAVMLPEGIYLQHALWNFDKGGHLQNLLHQLKYHRLIGVGIDMGRQLGKSLLENPWFFEKIENVDAILIPVPLHSRKRRIRGYNQAFYIAKGLNEVVDVPIISQKAVQRVKHTKTQTGFSLEKRRRNIDKAFTVTEPDYLKKKACIIVDDVFTTGATTFELADQLKDSGASDIMIATVAQA